MIVALATLIIYLGVKFLFTQQLDSYGPYTAYIFETLLVIAVGFYYRNKVRFHCDLIKEIKISFLPALVAGLRYFQSRSHWELLFHLI